VIAWNMAIRCFGLSEGRAAQGRWASALKLLLRALALDPVRTGAHLGYRAARLAGRKLGGAKPAPARPDFFEVDPASRVPSDPHELSAFARALERLDARRMDALGKGAVG
jgi:hypothetical protein